MKSAEAEEADENKPSAEQNAASQAATQKAFRADLNHKLRTPLNAIIGFAELLVRQTGNERMSGDARQILKSARELLRVLESELEEPAEDACNPTPANAPRGACDILYIEDDVVNFTLVERILELRPKLTLRHAMNGTLGLRFAGMYCPKLILLDLNLPDLHGAEVLQRLRAQSGTAEIPVVILSANATPSQIERLLAAGAANYLTKPFDLDPFLAVIDDHVAELA